MSIGNFGVIEVFEDFLAPDAALTWSSSAQRLGQVGQVSVNEGSFDHTVDEPGGILKITTDTADNDNCALYVGPFKPSDGGVVMEARFKVADITTCALFVGFTETLDAATPVMPAEFATTTMTYNGTGGMVGLQFDSDGTTDDWRAVAGDGGAVSSNADANGTRAYNAPVNDKFDVVRVEIDVNGTGRVYLAEDSGSLKLIKEIESAVTASDIEHAVLMIENRSGAASVMEVDYFYAKGNRDWTQ